MSLAWIWSGSFGILFIISWAGFLWSVYPLNDIINEREKKTKEEKIAGAFILVGAIAVALSLVRINEIEELGTASALSLSLLMIGLILARWASLRKIPYNELSKDLERLLLYPQKV